MSDGPEFQDIGPPRMALDDAISILLECHMQGPDYRSPVATLSAYPMTEFYSGPTRDDYARAWLTLWNYRELRRHG